MTDILLDAAGDIAWDNGLVSTVSGDDEKVQQLWIHLSIGLGEWAFDTEAGFPYRAATSERGVPDTVLEGWVRRVTDKVLGEGSLIACDISLDPATKVLTITADTVYGPVTVTS